MTTPNETYERLIAFVAGELETGQAAEVERLIRRDADAARTVAVLRGAIDTLRSEAGLLPSPEMVQRAKGLLRAAKAVSTAGLFETLRQVVAELVYDSRPQVALAGVRGAASAYQLAFECDAADVDLEIEASGDGGGDEALLTVRGQVSPRTDARVGQVALAEPKTQSPLASTVADEHGMFELRTNAGQSGQDRFVVEVSMSLHRPCVGGVIAPRAVLLQALHHDPVKIAVELTPQRARIGAATQGPPWTSQGHPGGIHGHSLLVRESLLASHARESHPSITVSWGTDVVTSAEM